MPHLLWILLLALLISCSPRAEETDYSFRIYRENGVTMAETTGGPKYEGELFTYDLLYELTEDPTREESLLYQVYDFRMDGRGFCFVLDGGNDRIAVFDNKGHYAYSIGRGGGGPGEFGRTFYITDVRGDTLHVFDSSQHRIHLFRTEGSLIDVIRVRRPNPFCRYTHFLSEDRFVSLGLEQTNPNIGPVSMCAIAIVHDSIGDTLSGSSAPWINTHYSIPGDMNARSYPLGPRPSYFFRHGFGWIVTAGIEPVLEVLGTSGNVRRRIELDLPRIPVTREDYTLHRASIDWSIEFTYYIEELMEFREGQYEERRDYLKLERDHFELSEYRAFWQSVYIDDAFFIWLKVPEHFIEVEEAGAGPLYMILSPEGEFLGYTRIPKGDPFNINHGHFLAPEWVLEETRSRLKVYRIRPAVEDLKYP